MDSLYFAGIILLITVHGHKVVTLNADDIACCNEYNVRITTFIQWFDKKLLLPEHDPLVNKFAKCWLNRRGYVNSDGVMNESLYREWIRATTFRGIDTKSLTEADLQNKERSIDAIIPFCKDHAKFSDDDDYRIIFYNCVASKVYDIKQL
ncbi:hypothetical protein RI129_010592 [Pyrocoelia pectoralis]|uniref:Uncharacterized protein n=1 Tax=Pyrocoelia pectoralis TaxID=417401 RepID=A0AAN7V797_9COLE